MKLFSSVLLAAAGLSQCARAFDISSDNAVAPAEPLGDNEPFVKTWTVMGETPLTALQLQTLGRVFVSYDESLATSDATTLAKIVFSGNNTALLETFEVINAEGNENAVKIHLKNDNFEGQGYVLTHVFVATKQALNDLSVASSSDTVIGDDVLVSANASAALKVGLAGSANVYVGSDSTAWSLSSLAATVAGSGNIQVLAKSLLTTEVVLNVAGSGDIAVVAEEAEIGSLESTVAGSGDITVQSENLKTYNLTTAIAGSGDVTYSKKGSCQEQSIALAGSGDVSAGSIVCVNTDVSLVGSGDVLVQTTGNLSVTSMFGSEIRYYGAKPNSITVSGLFSFRGSHKNTGKVVKEAKRNSYDEYDVEDAPKQAPVYVVVKTSPSFFSDEPKIRYDLELDTYDAETVEEFLAQQESSYQMAYAQNAAIVHAPVHVPGFALFAVVGAALAAVGVAAAKYKSRREREQYQPLM